MRHDPVLVHEARVIRRVPTAAEALLWQALRDRRLMGLKFRRQVPVGPLVLSFVCPAARLAILADGSAPGPDRRRDAVLALHGLRLLHLRVHEVTADTAAALRRILQAVAQ